jgi:hypothetical protein
VAPPTGQRRKLLLQSAGVCLPQKNWPHLPGLLCLVAVASLALGGGTLGQQAARLLGTRAGSERAGVAAVPSAKAILKKYLDATGGRKAWEKVRSRVSQGTVAIPAMNLVGTAETFERAPDLALVKIVISGSTFLEGFDGKVAWSSNPKDGLREQTGPQLVETRRESDFRFPLDFRRLYPTVSAPSAATIGDESVYMIEATPPEGGQPDRAYFDTQSGLLVRMVTQHHTEGGTIEPVEEDFSDYHTVDGIKIPFTIHQSGAQVDFTIELQNVQQNVPVDDTRFSKPVVQ